MNIHDALTAASIAVSVSGIAIATWQILVRRARLADVAPLLIGAFLIAAMAQVARMVI
jgi:type IV secretion system protein VirB2